VGPRPGRTHSSTAARHYGRHRCVPAHGWCPPPEGVTRQVGTHVGTRAVSTEGGKHDNSKGGAPVQGTERGAQVLLHSAW